MTACFFTAAFTPTSEAPTMFAVRARFRSLEPFFAAARRNPCISAIAQFQREISTRLLIHLGTQCHDDGWLLFQKKTICCRRVWVDGSNAFASSICWRSQQNTNTKRVKESITAPVLSLQSTAQGYKALAAAVGLLFSASTASPIKCLH